MPQVSGLPAQLSYPGQTNYSYIFFTKSFQGLHARWGGGGGGGGGGAYHSVGRNRLG